MWRNFFCALRAQIKTRFACELTRCAHANTRLAHGIFFPIFLIFLSAVLPTAATHNVRDPLGRGGVLRDEDGGRVVTVEPEGRAGEVGQLLEDVGELVQRLHVEDAERRERGLSKRLGGGGVDGGRRLLGG